MNTIDAGNLRSDWLRWFHFESECLAEIDRLCENAVRAGQDIKHRNLTRAWVYAESPIRGTVENIKGLGGLLFCGHNTKMARAIKKEAGLA